VTYSPVGFSVLRTFAPDLPLPVGAVLGGRVLSREGDRGMLLLAGARVAAQLPDGVAAGDRLRLRVEDTSGDRLVLKVLEPAQAPIPAQSQLAALTPLALPGGGTARLFVEPDEEAAAGRSGAEPPRSIFLRYDSPVLGRVDVALTLTGQAIGAAVQLSSGEPAQLARSESASLQGALATAASRPALVQVLSRDETVDLRA
jgi:hypothetical protein